jgi:hypothetical protein
VRPSGKVNLLGIALFGALVYGVWYAVTYGPAWLDHGDVKEFVTAAFNAAKSENLGTVKGVLLSKMNDNKNLGWHYEVDEAGVRQRKPGLGVKDEQVVVERNDVTNMITISVEYDRVIELKPLEKEEIKHYFFMKTGPLN